MSNTERVLKRLRRNRPMLAVTLRIPEDVIDDLKRIAPSLGTFGIPALDPGLHRQRASARPGATRGI